MYRSEDCGVQAVPFSKQRLSLFLPWVLHDDPVQFLLSLKRNVNCHSQGENYLSNKDDIVPCMVLFRFLFLFISLILLVKGLEVSQGGAEVYPNEDVERDWTSANHVVFELSSGEAKKVASNSVGEEGHPDNEYDLPALVDNDLINRIEDLVSPEARLLKRWPQTVPTYTALHIYDYSARRHRSLPRSNPSISREQQTGSQLIKKLL